MFGMTYSEVILNHGGRVVIPNTRTVKNPAATNVKTYCPLYLLTHISRGESRIRPCFVFQITSNLRMQSPVPLRAGNGIIL